MREKITVVTPGSTRTTQCVYDGQALVAEHDSDGTTYRYLWGPDRSPLAVEVSRPGQAAAVYTYHTDAAGSVVALTDANDSVVAEYRYDAFGGVAYTGGTDPGLASRTPLRYRSYYYDAATALYYLPARYYEPATARFLSPDPAPPSAGDPLSLNRYAYCQGDPVNAEDPSGAVADIWGEHDMGVTIGMAVRSEHDRARRSGARGWRGSYERADHEVRSRRSRDPGMFRPSRRLDSGAYGGWGPSIHQDHYQAEWIRAHGLTYDYWKQQPGRWSFAPPTCDKTDIAATTVSTTASVTALSITSVAAPEASGLSAFAATAASSTGAAVVAGALVVGATGITAYGFGDAIADFIYGDGSIGGIIFSGLSLGSAISGTLTD